MCENTYFLLLSRNTSNSTDILQQSAFLKNKIKIIIGIKTTLNRCLTAYKEV